MFIDLITTFVFGFAAAGTFLLINHAVGKRLPRWLMPVCAGAAMLGFTIWSEYDWAERTKRGMPEGLEVVMEVEENFWYRPWTYAKPQVVRMMTVDLKSVQRKPETPDIQLVSLYLYGRWQQPARVVQLVDCPKAQWALATEDALLDPVEDGIWQAFKQDDALYGVMCAT